MLIGAAAIAFLYFFNPQDIRHFPRCPFLTLTGYKCPGCGTLRAIHSLLHLKFAAAWHFNPLLVVAIPILLGVLLSRKFAYHPWLTRTLLTVTIAYWIARNLFDF